MKELKISSYTDESGQDTQGKYFVVCTIICQSEKNKEVETALLDIEQESEKLKKWYDTGNKRRHKYINLLCEKNILNQIKIYYTVYQNKKDYINLIGAHVAKAILAYASNRSYTAKIFMDRISNQEMMKLKKEIKSYHIHYKKMRGIKDESNALIRLADAMCGLCRDLNNKNVAKCYRKLFAKAREI
ncbi:MAG: DUF3800 domain-containing protein [Patescibacteria group bacterium]